MHKERLGDGEPKFGESPTNRVLPVDHLSQADYEDEDIQDYENADGIRDYCTRLMRLELMNVRLIKKKLIMHEHIYHLLNFEITLQAIKPDKRTGRQAEDAESLGLLGSYLDLDFDPVKVVGPLLNIMGSAAARNATSIDENYKKLPPFFKLQVTDFIQVFKSLLSTTDI